MRDGFSVMSDSMRTTAVRQASRTCWRWVFAAIAVVCAAAPAVLAQPVVPVDDSILTIQKVYLSAKPAKKTRVRFLGGRRLGTLKVYEDRFVFIGKKGEQELPFDKIRIAYDDVLPGDVDTHWAVLLLEDGLPAKWWAIRDGKSLGFGQRTPDIVKQIVKALRDHGGGQFRTADGWQPYTRVDQRVAFAIPEGWDRFVDDETTEGELLLGGNYRFRPPGGDGRYELRVALERPVPGFDCVKLSSRGQRRLIERVAERVGVTPDVVQPSTSLSGCRAIDLTWTDDAGRHMARIAADEKVTFWFERLQPVDAPEDAMPALSTWFETVALGVIP